jgi:hypothetical protein
MTPLQGMGPPVRLAVEGMCELAGVSRASYYRRWAASAPKAEETELRDRVQRLALAHRFYGYRRITELVRREGWAANRKRIARIMREDNLLALKRPAFKPATTDSRHSWIVWPNLARRLKPMDVDQLWVADITYVRLAEAFVFLAVILDAFSRKVVGWAMADHLRASLALGALESARQSSGDAGRARPSLRSRRSVRLRRLHRPARTGGDPTFHEPRRLPLRQRHGRELHEDPQDRGGRRSALPRPRRRLRRHRPVH